MLGERNTFRASFAVRRGALVIGGEMRVYADTAGWGGLTNSLVVAELLTLEVLSRAVVWTGLLHSAFAGKE